MQKIIGYIRESTMGQVKDGFNLDEQERRIHMYLDLYYKPGTYDLEIFREEGKSAKSLRRPEMQKLREMAVRRELDVLIVYSLDRLTRSVSDMDTLLKLFEDNHIELVSVDEKVDTHSPQGRFFIKLIALIAEWEREIIEDRTKRGLLESARQGNYVKGTPPIGYRRIVGNRGKLEVIPELSKVITRIFNDVGKRDIPVNAVAVRMSNSKVGGRTWREDQVRKILNTEEYYGTMVFKKKRYVNQVPAIITKEQYDDAQEKLNGHRHVLRNRYIYKERCYCSVCGSALTVNCSIKHKNKVYTYYHCPRCKRMINEDDITKQVDKQFTKVLKNDLFTSEIEKLQRKYNQAVTSLHRASYVYVNYGLTDAFYDALMDNASANASEIQKRVLEQTSRIDKVRFSERTYLEKRDFVIDDVKRLNIDVYDKKVIDIQFVDKEQSSRIKMENDRRVFERTSYEKNS